LVRECVEREREKDNQREKIEERSNIEGEREKLREREGETEKERERARVNGRITYISLVRFRSHIFNPRHKFLSIVLQLICI